MSRRFPTGVVTQMGDGRASAPQAGTVDWDTYAPSDFATASDAEAVMYDVARTSGLSTDRAASAAAEAAPQSIELGAKQAEAIAAQDTP